MTSYQPGIPTGLVNLDQDYQNIQNNFTQLNTTYGVDHIPLTQASSNGYHTVVHLTSFSTIASNPPKNQPVSSPNTVGGIGEIFSAQINDDIASDEALYFKTGGGRVMQFTGNFTPTASSNGATFLPGGLILNWGKATVNTVGSSTIITFTQPFTSVANVFSITIGCINTGGNSPGANNVYVKNGTVTASQFVVTNSASAQITEIYWMAIGK